MQLVELAMSLMEPKDVRHNIGGDLRQPFLDALVEDGLIFVHPDGTLLPTDTE